MSDLEKTLSVLNDIRMDIVKHNRQYIGKVKRQEAIGALAIACLAISQIINYTDNKFEDLKDMGFEPGHMEYVKDNEEVDNDDSNNLQND